MIVPAIRSCSHFFVKEEHVSTLSGETQSTCSRKSDGLRALSLLSVAICLVAQPVEAQYDGNRGTIPPSPFWKNQIVFPDDPFRVAGTSDDQPGWVKFTILLEPYDPNIVYFQDGHEYTFHYQFATELLEPFIAMTPEEFDQATLFEEGQKAILGAVILPPTGGYPPPPAYLEYGIQFVRQDPYTKEEIAEMFSVVKASISADPGVQAFYFPSYEQFATAKANRDWFEAQNIPISSAARWAEVNTCYSNGWALGELKYVEGYRIRSAYLAGELKPGDILLTDGVPAEIPFVAGIISLSLSTPNSHVAILAKTFGVPFAYLAVAEDAARALELVGHRIVLRAFDKDGGVEVRLIDIEGVLDEATIAEILLLKKPPALDISPMIPHGSYSASTDGLLPSDIKYFGGKAANFGILRTSIPDNSPVSVALSFDLWNEFLDQRIHGGNTLREHINACLSRYSYPPSDMAALSDELHGIRHLFTDTYRTWFSEAQKDAILAILQDPQYGFDANKKIRFRSSTNVEDGERFTGAGLYDSFSGCLADDLDGDGWGPCRCDPSESGERGVFRAIRRVFASFYNDNAFLERLRHGINEADVGMALLVHRSFPDEIELANGVATVERIYASSWDIKLVTQHGAISVTNPTDGSIPEEVSISVYSFGHFPTLVRQSNLVPLGGKVMDWQDDYVKLSKLLVKVGKRFSEVTRKSKFLLEMEYKKVAPDGDLVVKQVRRIPQPDTEQTVIPFLINEPAEYCTFQGEYGDVFANHGLKSRWLLQTQSLWLAEENLKDSLYTNVELEYAADGRIRALSGALPLLPNAFHRCNGGKTIDGWLMHHLPNRRACELHTDNVSIEVTLAESPMLTLQDIGCLTLNVEYERPVPSRDHTGLTTTTVDQARLCPCLQPQTGDLLQQRSFKGPNGVLIKTSFYWPPPPKGPVAGYTAPLVRWVETVVEGYAAEPVVLHGYYSQTYRPEHHNFSENFLFEPQLEPGLSEALLAELRAKGIRLIYVRGGMSDTQIRTDGFEDGSFLSGDLDRDGNVDAEDFALLAGRWLQVACDTCGGADLTGDGQVSFTDVCEIADNWLTGVE